MTRKSSPAFPSTKLRKVWLDRNKYGFLQFMGYIVEHCIWKGICTSPFLGTSSRWLQNKITYNKLLIQYIFLIIQLSYSHVHIVHVRRSIQYILHRAKMLLAWVRPIRDWSRLTGDQFVSLCPYFCPSIHYTHDIIMISAMHSTTLVCVSLRTLYTYTSPS